MANTDFLAYKTFDDFAAAYSFRDSAEMYSNGVNLIPVFRVKQWLEAHGLERKKEEMPSSFVGEMKARWIMPDKGYDPKRWRKCSNCNKHFELFLPYTDFTGNEHMFKVKADYCIGCGARMDGE